jgi:hypothetical protein
MTYVFAYPLFFLLQRHNVNNTMGLGDAFALVDRHETKGPAKTQRCLSAKKNLAALFLNGCHNFLSA